MAVDLGSTTVVARLVDCATGKILGETSTFNGQIPGGTDILTRIFTVRKTVNAGDPESSGNQHYHLCERTGSTAAVNENSCIAMAIEVSLTDDSFSAWDGCVPRSSTLRMCTQTSPDFSQKDLEPVGEGICLHLSGKVQLPWQGDIISVWWLREFHIKEKINAFFRYRNERGTRIGEPGFSVMRCGSCGTCTEGGVVKMGMRAMEGAVDR